MEAPRVSSRLFRALQTVNVEELSNCSDVELRPVLASLVRMSLIASLDKSSKCAEDRTSVLRILSRIELVNNLVALLSIDFHALETDVRKEMMLRSKVGNASGDSVLISNLNIGPALEFERSDATRRLRLVLSELLAIMGQVINLQHVVASVAERIANMIFIPFLALLHTCQYLFRFKARRRILMSNQIQLQVLT